MHRYTIGDSRAELMDVLAQKATGEVLHWDSPATRARSGVTTPVAAYVWILKSDGATTTKYFPSYSDALSAMRGQDHPAMALFDKADLQHWPSPVAWYFSNKPDHAGAIADTVSRHLDEEERHALFQQIKDAAKQGDPGARRLLGMFAKAK
jgi:hypothetical protein